MWHTPTVCNAFSGIRETRPPEGTSEPQEDRTYHVAMLVAHDLNLNVAGPVNVPEGCAQGVREQRRETSGA